MKVAWTSDGGGSGDLRLLRWWWQSPWWVDNHGNSPPNLSFSLAILCRIHSISFFSLFGCYRFTVITLIQLAFVQVWNVLFEWNRLDGGWFSFDILLRIFWAARILWVSNGFVDLVSIPSSKNILVGLRFLEILLVAYWNLLRFRFIRIVILAYNLNQFSRLLRFF